MLFIKKAPKEIALAAIQVCELGSGTEGIEEDKIYQMLLDVIHAMKYRPASAATAWQLGFIRQIIKDSPRPSGLGGIAVCLHLKGAEPN